VTSAQVVKQAVVEKGKGMAAMDIIAIWNKVQELINNQQRRGKNDNRSK
jgi:hypothetical protein